MREIDKISVAELVLEDHLYACVLDYFGVEFLKYQDDTLEKACQKHNLSIKAVIKEFKRRKLNHFTREKLTALPIEVIVGYLKTAHRSFTQDSLPFVCKLISDNTTNHNNPVLRDLELIFPVFVEDFIYHIHEEEDTLFHYISTLYDYLTSGSKQGLTIHLMEKYAMNTFAMQHVHDDEMRGIREITNHYTVSKNASLQERVLMKELHRLDQVIKAHADVEDMVLFKKAIALEEAVKAKIAKKIALN